MKLKKLFLLLFVAFSIKVIAQQPEFYPNGYDFTPKGHMHCLIVEDANGNLYNQKIIKTLK